jgi:hypothetical protein
MRNKFKTCREKRIKSYIVQMAHARAQISDGKERGSSGKKWTSGGRRISGVLE